jgi:hypothetical protein
MDPGLRRDLLRDARRDRFVSNDCPVPGFMPGIHVFVSALPSWVPGTDPRIKSGDGHGVLAHQKVDQAVRFQVLGAVQA